MPFFRAQAEANLFCVIRHGSAGYCVCGVSKMCVSYLIFFVFSLANTGR